MKKFFIVFGVLLCLFALLYVDDALDPDVVEWVESIDYQTQDESYLYLLGLNAENQEPTEFGRAKLVEMRRWEAALKENPAKHIESAELSFEIGPENRLVTDCMETYFRDYQRYEDVFTGKTKQVLTTKQSKFVERYQKWIKLGPPRHMSWPNVMELFPNYVGLVYANDLYLRSLVSKFLYGDAQVAATEMQSHIAALLEFTASTNHLVEKMISLVMLNASLEVTSLMAQQKAGLFKEINVDSQQLIDLKSMMPREFATFYNYYQLPNFGFVALSEEGFWSVEGMVERLIEVPLIRRLLYKRNMTANVDLWTKKHVIKLSRQSPQDFIESFDDPYPSKYEFSKLYKLRNWGFAVAEIGSEQAEMWNSYLLRGFDVYAKIVLVNKVINGRSRVEITRTAINPFTHEADASWGEDQNRLCFDRPIKLIQNEKHYHCIFFLSDADS